MGDEIYRNTLVLTWTSLSGCNRPPKKERKKKEGGKEGGREEERKEERKAALSLHLSVLRKVGVGGAVSGYSGVFVETRRSSSHHNAPEDAAHAQSLLISFYSRVLRGSEPPFKPTAPGGGYLTFPSAEPSVRSGEGAVMGSVGLTALEDVGKYVPGGGN